MGDVGNSVSSLINAFTPAIQKLSELFGIGVDQIKAHGMEYILMYGKYQLFNALVSNFLVSFFVPLIIGSGIATLALWPSDGDDWQEMKESHTVRKAVMLVMGITLFITVITELATVIPYWASPEIYSIQAVMNLLQSAKRS